MPKEPLSPVESTAYALWQLLDVHDRPYRESDGMPLPLPLGAIRSLTSDYGLCTEMQELIIALEHAALPLKVEGHTRRQKRGGKKG